MSRIHIHKPHQLDRATIRSEVEQLAAKFAEELAADYRWRGDRMEFKRSGASGYIAIGDDSLEIEIKLGMLLRPLKSKIETKINTYLDDALG